MNERIAATGRRTLATPSRFEAVPAEDLVLVSGGLSWGGVWNAIKGAAKWVKDHVYVDTKNNAGGIKGKF
ncbi:MAG TPA: hypothetical protein PKC18_14145 [Lacipirellulaceae bacterium]|nr:hypothetical protein [Lacipirellulaceae bacterium]HMP04908.1 hypothetical protein [Lacipirellulaceae bacterium]